MLHAEYLGHDYNMGRIVGGDYAMRTLLLETDADFFALAPLLRYRFGTADRYQWNLDLAGTLQSQPDRLDYSAGLYGLSGDYRIEDGHVMRWALSSQNMQVSGTGHSIISGLDEKYERTLDLGLSDSYLSREGYIELSPDEYSLAFLRGPLLNVGQYRHTLWAGSHLGDQSQENAYVSYAPSLGLLPGLQLGLRADADLYDFNEDPLWSNLVRASLEWRLSRLWLATSAYQSGMESPESLDDWDLYHLDADLGLLLGKRTLNFDQVQGNYDGWFTPMLGGGQFLFTHHFAYDPDQTRNAYSYTSGMRAGLMQGITVGATHHREFGNDDNDHSLRLDAVLSNIPLRNAGPYDQSDMEYLWGYLFQPGDIRLDARWTTPLLDPSPRMGFIGSPIYRQQVQGSPSIGSFSSMPWTMDSLARVDLSLQVGIAEGCYLKTSYAYYSHGFALYGDSDDMRWLGSNHVGALGLGYMRFDAIWEAGLQMQAGDGAYPSYDTFNIFPFYIRGLARF